MTSANLSTIGALVLILSQGLLFGQTRSQSPGVQDQVSGPLSQGSVHGDPIHDNPPYDNPLAAKPMNARTDIIPKKPHWDSLELQKNVNDFQTIGFPNDGADKGLLIPKKEQSGDRDNKGVDIPREPQRAKYLMYEDQQNVFKRPLATVESGFRKTETVEGLKSRKRQLDHFGSGLTKQPQDKLGSVLFKKQFHHSKAEGKPFTTSAASFLEDRVEGLNSDGKQAGVEMILKGLGLVEAGLFKSGAQDITGFAQIREGFDQLSKGLGNRDPRKEFDMTMVKRGLDRFGAGLLTRGLDTAGLGLIKRSVDNLEMGMTEKAPSKALHAWLGVFRKGMDHVSVDLIKNGFDKDGVNMITKGAMTLVTWLIKHGPHVKTTHATHTFSDKHGSNAKTAHATYTFNDKPEIVQKSYRDSDSWINQKSLDISQNGLTADSIRYVFTKKSYNLDFYDGDMKDVGSAVFMKDYKKADNAAWENKHPKAPSYTEFTDYKAALGHDKHVKPDEEAWGGWGDVKPEVKKKSLDVSKDLLKKRFDELSTDVTRKDLHYVGSRLARNEFDKQGSKEFGDLDWQKKSQSDDRPQEMQKERAEKMKNLLKMAHSDKFDEFS